MAISFIRKFLMHRTMVSRKGGEDYSFVGEHTTTNGGLRFYWPQGTGSKQTVRQVIASLPPPPLGGSPHPRYPLHRSDKLTPLNKQRIQALAEGQGRFDLPNHLQSPCHRNSNISIGHRKVYGRMSWDKVAPTITARFDSFTRGQFGHPDQDRSISLYEGALLQSFPPNYQFYGNKVQVARQIGNAVPPLVAFELGSAILRALRN